MDETGGMHPAVITLRPDNILTVGVLFAGGYVGALLLVQLAMRAGLLKSQAPASAAAPPQVIV